MRVDVSGHHFIFPFQCACCGAAPNGQLAFSASRSWGRRVERTETKAWDVPYCSRCITHVHALEEARSFAKTFTVLSILLSLLVGYVLDPYFYFGIAVGVVAIVGTVMTFGQKLQEARSLQTTSCVNVDKAVAYLGWSGTLHRFEFTSRHFARAFMAANQDKLVNLSVEQRWLLSEGGSPVPNAPRSARRYIT